MHQWEQLLELVAVCCFQELFRSPCYSYMQAVIKGFATAGLYAQQEFEVVG